MIRIREYVLERPKSRSLYEQIRQDIRHQVYQPHEKLPSKREMAAALNVSVITIQAAYEQLEAEGYIEAKARQGYFVCPLSGYQKEHEKDFVFTPLESEPLISDPDFPVSLWYKTMRQVISINGDELLQKSPNEGSARLRNAIANYLYRIRGMKVQPAQVIIGSGAESLYTSIVRLFSRDMKMAIESGGYVQIERIYQAEEISLEKLPVSDDGIDSDALKNSSAQFLHVTPSYSFVSSRFTSAKKRKEYLDWIASKEGYLIEDDFNSELSRASVMPETLYAMDSNHKVIYINTFSKSLSASLRLGYMVLPLELLDLYKQKMSLFSNSVPLLEQVTLAAFIENGSFERHLNRKRRRLVLDHPYKETDETIEKGELNA